MAIEPFGWIVLGADGLAGCFCIAGETAAVADGAGGGDPNRACTVRPFSPEPITTVTTSSLPPLENFTMWLPGSMSWGLPSIVVAINAPSTYTLVSGRS